MNIQHLPVISCNTVVVGSGVAALNAADRLVNYGQKDVVIVTEGMNMGTSRNTGSDKQTYYKLTLSGAEPDSVYDMARTLSDGEPWTEISLWWKRPCLPRPFTTLWILVCLFPIIRSASMWAIKRTMIPGSGQLLQAP